MCVEGNDGTCTSVGSLMSFFDNNGALLWALTNPRGKFQVSHRVIRDSRDLLPATFVILTGEIGDQSLKYPTP